MIKTISTWALLVASQSALAMPRPDHPGGPQEKPKPVFVKACLMTYKANDGSVYSGCDMSKQNKNEARKLLKNGCAEGQVSVQFLDKSPIESCMLLSVVQL